MSVPDKLFNGDYTPATVPAQAEQALIAQKKTYPELMKLLQSQLTPQALAELQATQAVTPGYNDLAVGEIERLGPRVTAAQGAMDAGQAQADLTNIGRFGQPLGETMRAADASANPEYYSNLALAGGKMSDALNAWSPNLSAGQRAEVERGIARLNPGGADNSAVTTAEKAMEFGTAHQNQVKDFSNAINMLTQTVPTLKTGLNPVGVAMGRDSRTSPTMGAVNTAVKPSQVSTSIGANQAQGMFNAAMANENIRAGKFKSWGDAFNQDSETFRNVASGANSLGAGN